MAFIVTINILPYTLTGEGKALVDAFIINRISITPENQAGIIDIFFMASTKAPLIVLPLIVSNAYIIAYILKGVREKRLNIKRLLGQNIDIIVGSV